MQQVELQERRRLFRDALEVALSTRADVEVAGACATHAELLDACRRRAPDVALFEMIGNSSSVASLVVELRLCGVQHLVGLAAPVDLPQLPVEWPELEIVDRTQGLSVVLEAVTREPPAATDRTVEAMGDRRGPGRLTARQAEVMRLTALGLTSKRIARCLEISSRTVEKHRQQIRHKLGAQNQAHAVALELRGRLAGEQAAHTVIGR